MTTGRESPHLFPTLTSCQIPTPPSYLPVKQPSYPKYPTCPP